MNFIMSNTILKENTRLCYKYRIIILCKLFNAPIHVWIFKPDEFAPLLRKEFEEDRITHNSYKSHLVCVLALMSYSDFKVFHTDIYNLWYRFFIKAKKKEYVNMINHIPSKKQILAHIDWKTVIKNRDLMKNKLLQEYVLLALITMIPPRRQRDWVDVKLYNNSDVNWKPTEFKHNYINIGFNNPYILISEFKTDSSQARWYKAIPEKLLVVLKNFAKAQPNREYLFLSRDGTPYANSSSFAKWSNKVIADVSGNPKATMNSMRHAFVDHITKTYPFMTSKERLTFAKDMGHSQLQNQNYRHFQNPNPIK